MNGSQALDEAGDGARVVREHVRREAYKPRSIVVFVIAYAVFAAARVAVRVDSQWYDSLESPPWVMSALAQEVIWFAMFGLLALSTVYVFRRAAGTERGHWILFVRVLHYVTLQGFVLLLFWRRDLLLAAADASLLAASAVAATLIAIKASAGGARLLGTYSVWVLYNAAASWAIWAANGR